MALRMRLRAFFDGAENAPAGPDTDPDPLLGMVQQYPDEAAWFIKVVMFFGSISGIIMSIPCGAFLSMHWAPCGMCNRPLRYWILVHCLLQLMQAPVRLVFFLRLRRIQHHNGNVQECVRRLTHSSAWKTSKAVSIVTYGWFILGVVWLLNSTRCTPCPGLYRLSLAVIFAAVARLLMTILVFYHSFPPRGAADAGSAQKGPQGASQELIDTIPLVSYVPGCKTGRNSESGCAVCLSEFEWGDSLRQLPCGHVFHRPCIDKWLKRNKLCPLCLRDIEVPLLRHRLNRRLLPKEDGS